MQKRNDENQTTKSRRGIHYWMLGVLFVLLLLLYAKAEPALKERAEENQSLGSVYFIPGEDIIDVLSMGYRLFWADIVLIESQALFYDLKMSKNPEKEKIDKLTKLFEFLFKLDPKYQWGYYFANFSLLYLEKMMGAAEANRFLKYGFRHLDDYKLPMYIGFNFFEYTENAEAVEKWMSVAKALYDEEKKSGKERRMLTSGTPKRLGWIISAAYQKKGDSPEAQMRVFCSLCKEETSKSQKRHYCKYCTFHTYLFELNDAAKKFKAQFSKAPEHMGELVRPGFLRKIPEDPLGGNWVITSDGRINSTKNKRFNLNVEEER